MLSKGGKPKYAFIFFLLVIDISVSTEEASAMPVLNGVVNRVRNVINLKLGREINIDV